MIPLLGLKNAMVVYSHDGMDELSTSCKNTIINVSLQDSGIYSFKEFTLGPSNLGLPKSTLNELTVKNKSQSVMETMRVIYGIKSNKLQGKCCIVKQCRNIINWKLGKFV